MATDERLLYEAHTIWAEDNECKALYLIIEGHNREIFLCWEDDKDLAFWQALASLWERAPLMQLRLKEARDALLAAVKSCMLLLAIASAKWGLDVDAAMTQAGEAIAEANAEPTD